ncbi:DNA ligase 1 [Gossypium australe]|uniref:DNA ligase 1 n=1 Tax=Gossypium australe TaxID=47621 RepID=A0A5B6VE84_9ROSI|nr:DNA ligase 1 [Gossypium australe]
MLQMGLEIANLVELMIRAKLFSGIQKFYENNKNPKIHRRRFTAFALSASPPCSISGSILQFTILCYLLNMVETATENQRCSPFDLFKPYLLCVSILVPSLVLTSFLGLGFYVILFTTTILIISTSFLVKFSKKSSGVLVENPSSTKLQVEDEVLTPLLMNKTVSDAAIEADNGIVNEFQVDDSLELTSERENVEMKWMISGNVERNREISDEYSTSEEDDEGLIEIAIPSNDTTGLNEEPKPNLQSNLPTLLPEPIFHQQDLVELLEEINEVNEEENLIEIDISMEETRTEVPEPVANGTSLLEKSGVAVAEKIEEENNVVKEMEEDKKDNENVETEKMYEDQEGKQDKESKEEFEEGKEDSKTEAMEEEESHSKENDKEVEKEENKDEVEEKVEELKEEEKTRESEEGKGSKKRGKVQNSGEKVKEKIKKVEGKKETEQSTPLRDRPVSEHKSVERLVASIDKDASREFQVKKAVQVKSNISRFSGFVWLENEEKQKTKVKEKLLDFYDMLDIPSTRATARKEDIIAKLIDFLEAPHATTAVLLAEEDKVLNFNCSFCQLSIFTHFLRYSFCLLASLVGVESGKGLPGKMVAKGKDKAKKRKVKPSDYELRTTICGILKEVDFNTIRHKNPKIIFYAYILTDSLYVSVQRFDTDLTPRKLSVKLMIQEELTKLADDEDGEEDGEKDGAQSAGQELEA